MAGSRSRISRANRNFDDARAARLYRLRASGLQPGDPLPGAQQSYHVSPAGSDAASGLAPANAWATAAKVNGFAFPAGSPVLFERGGTWRETLTISRANLIINAYGSGAAPMFAGSNVFSPTWTLDQDFGINRHPDPYTPANWTRDALTSVTANVLASDDTTRGLSVIANTTSIFHRVWRQLTVGSITAGTSYRLAMEVKAGSKNFVRLAIQFRDSSNAAVGGEQYSYYNVTTGALGSNSTGIALTRGTEAKANGWLDVFFDLVAPATAANAYIFCYISTTNSSSDGGITFAGDGSTVDMYMFHPRLMETAKTTPMFYSAALSGTTPAALWQDDTTLLTKKTAKADMTDAGLWWHDTGTNTVWLSTTNGAAPGTHTLEVATRLYGVAKTGDATTGVMVNNLQTKHTTYGFYNLSDTGWGLIGCTSRDFITAHAGGGTTLSIASGTPSWVSPLSYHRIGSGTAPASTTWTGPSTGTIGVAASPSTSSLEYDVTFLNAGTYRIWVRAAHDQVVNLASHITLTGTGITTLAAAATAIIEPEMKWVGTATYPAAVAEVAVAGLTTVTLSVNLLSSGVRIGGLFITDSAALRPGRPETVSSLKFVDSVGVNTHLHYYVTTAYDSITKYTNALDYLGIKHVRDTGPQGATKVTRINTLIAAGYKFCFAFGNPDALTMQQQLDYIKQCTTSGIIAVEGPNETDSATFTYNGLTAFPADIRAWMADQKTLMDADPVLGDSGTNVTIVQTSFAKTPSPAQFGDGTAWVDRGNAHVYPGFGDPAGTVYGRYARDTRLVSAGKTMWSTESGFHTALNQDLTIIGTYFSPVNHAVQAKYITRMLLEQFIHGYERTYIYELLDQREDAGDTSWQDNYGIYNFDATPKPAAEALARLIDILEVADGTQSHTAGNLKYTLSGMPAAGDDLILKKSDSAYYLVLWNDADGWDHGTQQAVTVADVSVTVTTERTLTGVTLRDPHLNTQSAVTVTGGTSFAVTLPDHPVVLEIAV